MRQARAERGAQLLAAFSYRGVLARGFALVRDAAGRPLHTAAAVTAGMAIEVEFSDGRVGARAEGGAVSPGKPADKSSDSRLINRAEPAKPRTHRDGSDQGNCSKGSLF